MVVPVLVDPVLVDPVDTGVGVGVGTGVGAGVDDPPPPLLPHPPPHPNTGGEGLEGFTGLVGFVLPDCVSIPPEFFVCIFIGEEYVPVPFLLTPATWIS